MSIFLDPTTGQYIDDQTGMPVDPGATPGYAEPPPEPMAPPQPQAQNPYFTPDQMQAQQADVPVSMPGQMAQPGVVTPSPINRSASVDVSTRQYEEDVYKKQAPIRGKRAREEAGATQQVQGIMDAQGARYSTAANEQIAAQRYEAEIQARKLDADRTMLESRGRLEQRMIAAEEAANSISRAEVMAARGRFEQQAAVVRAASVDPTLNFTPGELAGVAGAVFAQFFLGAQNVQAPDVQGTMERWTDRYVDNQMEKIRRGERLLDSEQAVWDMVRSEAADDTDARARLRALTLNQASTAMETEAARWGSELARAQGAQAVASIKSAYAAQMAKMESDWFDKLLAQKQFIQQKHYQDLSASIASRHAAVAEKELAMKQSSQVAGSLGGVHSIDKGGQLVGKFRSWVTDPQKGDIIKARGNADRIVQTAGRLQSLYDKFGGNFSDAGWSRRFLAENGSVVASVRSELAAALKDGYGTGANLTQFEIDALINPNLPMDQWLNVLGNKGAINVLTAVKKNAEQRFDAQWGGFLQDPTAEEVQLAGRGYSGDVASGTDAEWEAVVSGEKPTTSKVERAAGAFKAAGQGSTGATMFTELLGITPRGSAQRQSEWDSENEAVNERMANNVEGGGWTKANVTPHPTHGWTADLAEVARALVGAPDPWGNPDVATDVQEEKQRAVDFLQEAAKDKDRPERAAAAQRLWEIYLEPGGEQIISDTMRLTKPKDYGDTITGAGAEDRDGSGWHR